MTWEIIFIITEWRRLFKMTYVKKEEETEKKKSPK